MQTVPSQETWRAEAQEAALEAARAWKLDRSRQARWDAEHVRTASCRLRVEEMERLKAECRAQGTTVYGLLRYMIAAYLAQRRRDYFWPSAGGTGDR